MPVAGSGRFPLQGRYRRPLVSSSTEGAGTPFAGNLTPVIVDYFFGATPGGPTAFNQTATGSITASSALSKAVTATEVGTATPTGAPRNATSITRAGSSTPSGILAKLVGIVRGGTLWRNAFVQPARQGAYASVPNSTALELASGDIQLVAHVRPRKWNVVGSAERVLVSKPYGGTGCYYFTINTANQLVCAFTLAASPTITRTAAKTLTVVEGQGLWIRATRVAATGVWSYDQAPTEPNEPTAWTSLGTVAGLAGAMGTTTQTLRIGGDSSSGNWHGAMHRVIMRDGATTVLDVDFVKQAPGATSFTEDSANAATVSVLGGGPAYIGPEPGGYLTHALTGRTHSGSTTPTGAPRKAVSVARSGSITPSATLATIRAILQVLAGAIAAASQLVRRTSKNTVGTVTPSSTVSRGVRKGVVGTITSSGTVRKAAASTFVGTLVAAGAIRRAVSIIRTGVSALTGALATVFTGGGTSDPATVTVTVAAPSATLEAVAYQTAVTVAAPSCELAALPYLTELTAAAAACTLETV